MSISGSSISTSGGLYYWTNYYAPPRVKTVLSYLIGNTNSIALVGSFCSVVYGFAIQVYAIVVIARDGDFEVTQAKLYGVFVACVIAEVAVTCLSSKTVHIYKLFLLSAMFSLSLCIFLLCLLVPEVNSNLPLMSLVNLRIYRIGQLVGLKFPLPGFQQFGQLVPLTVLFINLKKYTMPVESFQLVYWDQLVPVVYWEQS